MSVLRICSFTRVFTSSWVKPDCLMNFWYSASLRKFDCLICFSWLATSVGVTSIPSSAPSPWIHTVSSRSLIAAVLMSLYWELEGFGTDFSPARNAFWSRAWRYCSCVIGLVPLGASCTTATSPEGTLGWPIPSATAIRPMRWGPRRRERRPPATFPVDLPPLPRELLRGCGLTRSAAYPRRHLRGGPLPGRGPARAGPPGAPPAHRAPAGPRSAPAI